MLKKLYQYNINFLLLILLYGVRLSFSTRCEPLEIKRLSICHQLKYNQTMFPNLLLHRTQSEALNEIEYFIPFVRNLCPSSLEFFLCTLFLPVCMPNGQPIPPCRDLCESARDGCLEAMNQYSILWPEYLKCKKFPIKEENVLCISKQNGHTDNNKNNGGKWKIQNPNCTITFEGSTCPAYQKKVDKYYTYMGKPKCASLCRPVYFTKNEQKFAHNWIFFWSLICIVSTIFTLLTFQLDAKRFKYPERPIIYLSGCYSMIGVAFLTGPLTDNAISCHNRESGIGLVNQGTEHAPCTIVFTLIYFFLMSASLWWVILTVTWFLAAVLKWGHEAIESNSAYFHAAAWGVSATKTITILALNHIEGDALSGTCFVGVQNVMSLRWFVLVPLLIYLIVGTLFLLAGFIGLIQIRKVLRKDSPSGSGKLTKLMVRIGIFSILYSLPAVIVIACLFYEQTYREKWNKSYKQAWKNTRQNCHNCLSCDNTFIGQETPDFTVFMIKYLMMLMVGITSGFWIWSSKTIQTWKKFYYKRILCKSAPNRKEVTGEGSVRTNFTMRTNLSSFK